VETTVDLPESLLEEVRLVAERRGWTLKTVFEESLRNFVEMEELRKDAPLFRLQHTIVTGKKPPSMTFAEMIEMSYLDR